ncbi:50S ribosomal protein L10 [Candidatus Woesearchaeota archaeon]|nr:50S ribosomal protein L10 [Candidatus Woesearchaeota archaeon]
MVSSAKQQQVQSLIREIQSNSIVGVANMQHLPAQQLQRMRSMLLREGVKMVMARKRLLHRALTESKKHNIELLIEKLKGMPTLILSNSNPFVLYAMIQKNKSEAPAKPGQTAPKDIIVKGGVTNFAPGPIISELASVGIKTKVEGGKLTIIQDVKVAKEGDVITAKLAETLKRLDIKPMEIGLNLVAVWENGIIFEAKQLHIDEAEYTQNFMQAAQWSFNLAVEIAYPTSDTTELLIQKAFREAKALSLEQNIITDLTAEEILEKVERQALSLKETAGIEVGPSKPKPVKEKKLSPSPSRENRSDDIPSADDLIKATKEHFRHQGEKKSSAAPSPVSAERLIDEDLGLSPVKKQGNDQIKEAENLFNKLKKEGTLRGK